MGVKICAMSDPRSHHVGLWCLHETCNMFVILHVKYTMNAVEKKSKIKPNTKIT